LAQSFSGPGGGMDRYSILSLPSFGPFSVTTGAAIGDALRIFSDEFVSFANGYAGATISGDLTVPGSVV
jgi:hypothetical protein